MPLELKPYNRNAPDDVIFADLRRVAAMLPEGKFLSVKCYELHGRFSFNCLKRRFGTWNGTLTRAGLPVGKPYWVPDDELFQNLLEMWRRLNRQPMSSDWGRVATKVSTATYVRRFGSWRKAIEAFAKWANQTGHGDQLPPPPQPRRHNPAGQRFATMTLRYQVMRRDGFKCVLCGRSPAVEAGVVLHVDHITPWVSGGKTIVDNLRTLCERCNYGKSDQSPGVEPARMEG